MSFGAPLQCFSRHYRQPVLSISRQRRERTPTSRCDRRPTATPDTRRNLHVAPSVPRVDPKRPTKLNALQQSPLLSTNKGTQAIHLPVDYIQLMGLRSSETLSESKVLTAFGRLSAAEIEEGFSARTMAGRQQLLEEAKDIALKSIGKKHTAEKSKGIELAYHLIPGALSLLAEAEEYDLVIQLGTKMLETRDASNMKRDVLLSMALAKLGQAEYYFSNSNQVAMACTCMEAALQLLRDGGSPQLAPGLSKEIEDALETYVPKCVLDQLKLPLNTNNMKGRKDAIAILQGLLAVPRSSDHSFIGVDRHYVKQVIDCLTSTEILQIIDWTTVLSDPKCVRWYYPGLLLKGAAVHIVVGFLQRRPALVHNMDTILNLPGKDREAHIEHVICKLLLGEVESAFEILDKAEGNGKQEGGTELRGDADHAQRNGAVREAVIPVDQNAVGAKVLPGRNETFAFIRAHSEPNNDDYLPGMCLFAERWLQNAGFTQFRDTATGRPSATLVDYFKDRKVQNSLNSSSGSHNGLFGMIPLSKKEERNAGTLPFGVDPKSNGTKPPSLHQGKDRRLFRLGSAQNSMSYISRPYSLPGAAQKRRRHAGWIPMLGGLALGSALFALIRHPWMHATKDFIESKASAAEIKTHATPPGELLSSTLDKKKLKNPVLPMRKADAEKLIQKWQFAKAEALGPKHEFKYMRRVLADPMLETWSKNIQSVAERGLFWKYKLDQCKVKRVDTSHLHDADGYIDVLATLKERAVMYGVNGKEVDRYKSRYNVAYHMIMDDEGRWKINHVKVITMQ